MLYEMLTTRLPLYATNFEAYMNKHLKEIPENPKTINHNIPDVLDALVMKCLENKPRDRSRCFKDLQKDLIEIYDKLSGEEYIRIGGKGELRAGDWDNKGASYAELGLFEKAEDAYRTALRLEPNNAKPHNNLGALLQILNEFGGAEKEWREAIRINPNFADARGNLGLLLWQKGRKSEAEEHFHKLLRFRPDLSSWVENIKRSY